MITSESLEDLDVVRTHEMKNLEEINFEIVMLERIKDKLEEFEMNLLETEIKERIKILQKKRNQVRKIFQEVNESELHDNEQKILKIASILIN